MVVWVFDVILVGLVIELREGKHWGAYMTTTWTRGNRYELQRKWG